MKDFSVWRKIFVICAGILITISLNAQRTGLVLSGGGAKGMAHIGVIKALEDNNIKIDYISGTSIGAIVGSLYAMGYSSDEMLELFKSEKFNRWKSGQIETKYQFRYKKGHKNSSIINIPLKKAENGPIAQIRTYIVPSQVMDFAFIELTAGADAACEGNFDSLMIPFRCIAADIYKKEAVICRSGSLAKSVRASMTYPVVFEPIYINSMLLLDGGIYNNFPFDVLVDDFDPDFIIGSKVVNKSRKPDKENIMLQLENMVMQPTNYNIPDSLGLVISSDLGEIDLLAFDLADSLYKIGYREAIKMIPEIKKRAAFISDRDLEARRKEFKSKIPELLFNDIYINGVDARQEEYIKNQISKQEKEFDLDQLKEEYYRLVSEENISNAYPEAVYNKETGRYDLLLDIKMKGAFSLSAGGLLSFTNYNQGYLGFDYHMLSDIYNRFSGNMYLGRFYSSFNLAHHIAIPKKNILLVDINLTGNRWNYFRNDISSLFDEYLPKYIIRNETMFSTAAGLPLSGNSTVRAGISFSWIDDSYYQTTTIEESLEPDNTQYFLATGRVKFESDYHNFKQYATEGNHLEGGIFYNTGFEFFNRQIEDTIGLEDEESVMHKWVTVRLRNENYARVNERFSMGTLVDITLSNKKFSGNYTATLINSYKFAPTPFTKQIFAKSLRSNSYMAAGLMPVYSFNESLSLRGGLYLFAPLYPVINKEGMAVYDDLLKSLRAVADLGVVYQTPVGPLSAGVNIFSNESKKAYYYINFGYILFNKSGED